MLEFVLVCCGVGLAIFKFHKSFSPRQLLLYRDVDIPCLERRQQQSITLQGAIEKRTIFGSTKIISHFWCTNIIFADCNALQYCHQQKILVFVHSFFSVLLSLYSYFSLEYFNFLGIKRIKTWQKKKKICVEIINVKGKRSIFEMLIYLHVDILHHGYLVLTIALYKRCP